VLPAALYGGGIGEQIATDSAKKPEDLQIFTKFGGGVNRR
jgi:hypothetical protein